MTDISDDMVRRMVDLVRGLASRVSNDDGDSGSFNAWNLISDCREARAIVAALPKPIDPDLLIARQICAEVRPSWSNEFLNGDFDEISTEMPAVMLALKKGRELATGKEGC